MCTSVPQMVVVVMRIRASVGAHRGDGLANQLNAARFNEHGGLSWRSMGNSSAVCQCKSTPRVLNPPCVTRKRDDAVPWAARPDLEQDRGGNLLDGTPPRERYPPPRCARAARTQAPREGAELEAGRNALQTSSRVSRYGPPIRSTQYGTAARCRAPPGALGCPSGLPASAQWPWAGRAG